MSKQSREGLGRLSNQGITGAMGAPNALPLEQSLQNVGIDLACVLFFGRYTGTL
jgi:hypothetical protein